MAGRASGPAAWPPGHGPPAPEHVYREDGVELASTLPLRDGSSRESGPVLRPARARRVEALVTRPTPECAVESSR